MSSTKLDQSLDDILQTRRQSSRRGRGRRAPGAGKAPTTAAPVGGVQKTHKQGKGGKAPQNVPSGPAAGKGESKIQVSNLPLDIDETQIKDYMNAQIGVTKKVILQYGRNGQSLGICTVIFAGPDSAPKAAKQLNGIRIDNRPMKVELLVDAQNAPAPKPAKSMAARITPSMQAKAQPKPVAANKAQGGTGGRGGRGGKRGRGGRRSNLPKKSAEDLDQEMADYWVENNPDSANGDAMVTNGGAVQAPTAGAQDEDML